MNNGSDTGDSSTSGRRERTARILVAEDNLVNQKVTLNQLKKLGYSAEAVANGRAVLSALSESDYDLILMDCQMPEMDGYETTVEIRRREARTRRTPIIAMTANAMTGDREKCFAAGMDDYLSKPVKQEMLTETLARWLSRQTTVHAAPDGAETICVQGHDVEKVVARLIQLAEEFGEDLSVELADLFITDTGERLARIPLLLSQQDKISLAREAHTLKGSCSSMGAEQMTLLSRQLENLVQSEKNCSEEELVRLVSQLEGEFNLVKCVLETAKTI